MKRAALALCLVLCFGCSARDASDPAYGTMFKQTTQHRAAGKEFWDDSTPKDCSAGNGFEVCTRKAPEWAGYGLQPTY